MRALIFFIASMSVVSTIIPAPEDSRLADAFERGAACAARDHDGRRFRDPYLTYVYPEEKLPPIQYGGSEHPETPTYRMIDADLMLAMIAATGARPTALQAATDAARTRLAALPPVWGRLGLNNVRKRAHVDGIALDTFCMVGALARDTTMAKVVLSAIDGDGWLPERLYEGDEAFRREADECWCLRFLAESQEETRAISARVVEVFRAGIAAEPGSAGSFYRAFHLGLALREDDPSDTATLEEITRALARWGALHGDDQILEWANLGTATFLRGDSGRELGRQAIRVLLDRQEEDGCWRVPGMSPPGYGATFLTLRALAALATELSRPGASNPAP